MINKDNGHKIIKIYKDEFMKNKHKKNNLSSINNSNITFPFNNINIAEYSTIKINNYSKYKIERNDNKNNNKFNFLGKVGRIKKNIKDNFIKNKNNTTFRLNNINKILGKEYEYNNNRFKNLTIETNYIKIGREKKENLKTNNNLTQKKLNINMDKIRRKIANLSTIQHQNKYTILKADNITRKRKNNKVNHSNIRNLKEKNYYGIHTLTKSHNDKNINLLNYINNKKNKLNSLENEKKLLINNANKNIEKYVKLLQEQKKEYKDYENFLKNELENNLKNLKILEIDKNNLSSFVNKTHINDINNTNSNIKYIFTLKKNKNQVSNNNLNYKNDFSNIQKSLQKYFSFNTSNSKDKIDKINCQNKEDNYKDSIKVNLNNESKQNNNIKAINIKIYNKNNQKTKIIKFKKKFHESNLISFDFYDNFVKSFELKKYKDNLKNKDMTNDEKILDINQQENTQTEKNLNQERLKKKPAIRKNLVLTHASKCKSLNFLEELNDYIGPNQYNNIIIPDNKRKIIRILSEEKEKESINLRNKFFKEENKKKRIQSQKLKDREMIDPEDYYKKKDFDKLILSGEKKSKYYNMRNLLYNSVFKSFNN